MGQLTDFVFVCKDNRTVFGHRAIIANSCKELVTTFPQLLSLETVTIMLPMVDVDMLTRALLSLYLQGSSEELKRLLCLQSSLPEYGSNEHEEILSSLDFNCNGGVEEDFIENQDNVKQEKDSPREDAADLLDLQYTLENVKREKEEFHSMKQLINIVYDPKQNNRKEVQKYPCDLCGKILGNKNSLETHIRKHGQKDQRTTKMTCDLCGQVISKRREHMLRKHPEALGEGNLVTFNCPQCSYSTRIKSTLKQHISNMHTERNMSCDKCEYKTAVKSQLNLHEKKVHGHPTIACSFPPCSRMFVQECDLRDHIKRTHPTGCFNCEKCGKQFINGEKLKRHIKMHNISEEGLPCKVCSQRFITNQKLKEHMNTHTGETPYRCPGLACDKAFMSSSALAHHKKSCSAWGLENNLYTGSHTP